MGKPEQWEGKNRPACWLLGRSAGQAVIMQCNLKGGQNLSPVTDPVLWARHLESPLPGRTVGSAGTSSPPLTVE